MNISPIVIFSGDTCGISYPSDSLLVNTILASPPSTSHHLLFKYPARSLNKIFFYAEISSFGLYPNLVSMFEISGVKGYNLTTKSSGTPGKSSRLQQSFSTRAHF
jgi:hypothetical protein